MVSEMAVSSINAKGVGSAFSKYASPATQKSLDDAQHLEDNGHRADGLILKTPIRKQPSITSNASDIGNRIEKRPAKHLSSSTTPSPAKKEKAAVMSSTESPDSVYTPTTDTNQHLVNSEKHLRSKSIAMTRSNAKIRKQRSGSGVDMHKENARNLSSTPSAYAYASANPSSTTCTNKRTGTSKRQYHSGSETKYRGVWTGEEDQRLIQIVKNRGPNGWTAIASELNTGRNGRQCRERWSNQINPDLKRTGWSYEEDAMILKLHKEIGNRWATIAKQLPGRTDNMVKNRFNGSLLPRTTRPESQRKHSQCLQKKGKVATSASKGTNSRTIGKERDISTPTISERKRRPDDQHTPTRQVLDTGSKRIKGGGKKSTITSGKFAKNRRKGGTQDLSPSNSFQRLTSAAAAVEILETASQDSRSPSIDSFHTLSRNFGSNRVVPYFSTPLGNNSPIKRNFVPSSGGSNYGIDGTSNSALCILGPFSESVNARPGSAILGLSGLSVESSPNPKKREVSSPFLPLHVTPNRFAEMLGNPGNSPTCERRLVESNCPASSGYSVPDSSTKCEDLSNLSRQTPVSVDDCESGTLDSSRLSHHTDTSIGAEAAMAHSETLKHDLAASLKSPFSGDKFPVSTSNREPIQTIGETPSKFVPSSIASPSILSMLHHLKNNLESSQKHSQPMPIAPVKDLKLDSNRKFQALVAGNASGLTTNGISCDALSSTNSTQSGFESNVRTYLLSQEGENSAMYVLSEAANSLLPSDMVDGTHSLLSDPGGSRCGKESGSVSETMSISGDTDRKIPFTPTKIKSENAKSTFSRSVEDDSPSHAPSDEKTDSELSHKIIQPVKRSDRIKILRRLSPVGRRSPSQSHKMQEKEPSTKPIKDASSLPVWSIAEKPCSCKRSKCLKLYCTCFSSALHCGSRCECRECSNSYPNELWKQAIEAQPNFLGASSRELGCRCRNSMCLKQYCVCYRNGATCTDRCSCEKCQNTLTSEKRRRQQRSSSAPHANK